MSDPTARLREQRRLLVGRSPIQQGLEGAVLVESGEAGTFVLELRFVPGRPGKPAIPPRLDRSHLRVLDPDGQPAEGIVVTEVETPSDPDAVTARATLRARDAARARVLSSDPRPYQVHLMQLPRLDPLFSSAPFFFVGALAEDVERPPEPVGRGTEPALREIDYLAKDYQSFRRMLLDQISGAAPGWRERNPADPGVMVAEVLAYAADSLSYYQDAVATEAYLWTARRRLSVRRHARLVGYRLGEGENAHTWAQIAVEEGTHGLFLPRGTQVLTRSGNLPPTFVFGSPEYEEALSGGALVFETQSPLQLHFEHQAMPLHTWGAEDFTLPEGATEAALRGHCPHLAAGDVLIFDQEVLPPGAGHAAGAAAERRWAVRLCSDPQLTEDSAMGSEGSGKITQIRWHKDDALPFPLTVAARVRGEPVTGLAIARGNVVKADHGRTVIEPLPPVPAEGWYEARLRQPDLTYQRTPTGTNPVVTLIEVDPALFDPQRPARPEDGAVWRPRPDLLSSDGSGRHFAVEIDSDGYALLRFGDGRYGRRPPPGARFWAIYRVGNGPRGNLGAEAIAHVVSPEPLVTGVTNPLPARGGKDRESLDRARLHAPPVLDRQDRCVAAEDFETHALGHPEVLAARIRLHCTAGGRIAVLSVQRRHGLPLDEELRSSVRALLQPFLLLGDRLELQPPRWAALEIVLEVRTASGRTSEIVESRLRRAFDSREPEPGTEPGFFHPDRWTFGQPVYLSRIIEHASRVRGVRDVIPRVFRRWGEEGEGGLVSGRIDPDPLEIARVSGRPGSPQLGTFRCTVEGPR